MILQDAYIQSVRESGEDFGDWIVYSKDGDALGRMPNNLDEKQAMALLRFARKHELEALNKGVEIGIARGHAAAQASLGDQINVLKYQNHDLARKLEYLIEHGMDDDEDDE